MVKKRKAVFFDRDGTLIKTYISSKNIPIAIRKVEQLRLLQNVRFVISKISKKYLIIVITNQPDVSRGLNSKENVIKINNKIKSMLKIDKIYTCYSNNNNNYMRKPNPGMIIYAKKKFNLNLKKCFMVGDRLKDIECGKKANCKTILIKKKYNTVKDIKPDFLINQFKDLLRIIKF